MTNVRCFLNKIQLALSLQMVGGQKLRVAIGNARLRAGRLTLQIVAFLFVFALLCVTTQAQESYTFGRTPVGAAPSGSAGGTMVDVNRNGLGFSARLGHEAGNTVGRTDSASIFQLSPFVNIGNGFAFGDSRLTYSNEGELAWSFGGGYRHYITAWDTVIGAYGYTDRDQITGANFRQWSVGGEILANNWEARANWYEPYGDTIAGTDSRIDSSSAEFVDNGLVFDRIDTVAEALRGFDAEVGFLLPGKFSQRIDLRAFGGGYWYEGEAVPAFAGFSTRLQADIGDHLEVALKLTDDEMFHTNVAFNATFHIGGFHSEEHTSRSAMQRMAEPVRRNLNIAALESDIVIGGEVAMIDDGGLRPLVIAHVDSNSTALGDGNVFTPFQTIEAGLLSNADIVFTHAGSEFTTAPSNQLTLTEGQVLFGEGFIQTGGRVTTNIVDIPGIGPLELPSSPNFTGAEARPILNNSGDTAVTLLSNTQFGGFIIEAPEQHGILISESSGVQIHDVTINNATENGIRFENAFGTNSILDTEILMANGGAFVVDGGNPDITFESSLISGDQDPAFSNISNSSGAVISVQNTTGGSVLFRNTTIDDDGGQGVIIADAAGNATISNASLLNSTSNGISITDSTGQYRFLNDVRDDTVINDAANESVLIDNLGAGGSVLFDGLMIDDSGGAGISVTQNAGNISFNGDVEILSPAAGVIAPFVTVTSSTETGSVAFASGLNIIGDVASAGGTGIQLTENTAGSIFSAASTSITNVGGQGINIFADASNVTFTNIGGDSTLSITDAALEGLRVFNNSGIVVFNNESTTITRTTDTVTPLSLVDISENSGRVSFSSLVATDTTGNTGVFLDRNTGGETTVGSVAFEDLNITTDGGTGLLATNNRVISSTGGNITSTDATAVDIEDSGINIQLDQVSSFDSPDFGIRLVNTNGDVDENSGITGITGITDITDTIAKTFTVGNGVIFGDGGTISGAADAGVQLENAGQVTLQGTILTDNNYGIRVINNLTNADGEFRQEDNQSVTVRFGMISDSNVRGIETLNLTLLDVQNTIFNDNGDVATTVLGELTNETIFVDYSQLPNDPDTTTVGSIDNPFEVILLGNSFNNTTDDTVFITQQAEAEDAHLNVEVDGNIFTHTDTVAVQTRVFAVDWDGPVSIDIDSNTFTVAGLDPANGLETRVLSIEQNSFTDELDLNVNNNEIQSALQSGVQGQTNLVGLYVNTALDINSNVVDSITASFNSFSFSGPGSTGMQFELNGIGDIALIGNQLDFAAIQLNAANGTGIEFNRIGANSLLAIQNNIIRLEDLSVGGLPGGETGLIVRATNGPYTILTNFSRNNTIEEFINGFAVAIPPNFIVPPQSGTVQVNGLEFP